MKFLLLWAYAAGLFGTADSYTSFDGKRILFAGRESAAALWQIYEADLPGGKPTQMTHCKEDCTHPVYLPDGIAYARKTADGFQVETLKNGVEQRLTYAPGDWFPTDVLADGRILLEGPHATAGRDIYTLYTDGSGIETVRCDHSGPRNGAKQATNGDIVFKSKSGVARFTPALAHAVPGGSPMPTGARPIPKKHPAALHDKDGSNLMSLDVYTSKLKIVEGSAAKVRVLSTKGALGEAPVETDGSFYIHVPSETPLRFELLDKTGKVVAAQKGWMWTRRGEQRICVGCHAGPERAPDNAVPKILVRDIKPTNIGPTNIGGRP